jgi:hypothetical protein
MMRVHLFAVAALAVLSAGCATGPLPDGSKIQRLPEPAAPAALTPEEARRQTELNAQILREQNAAQAREEHLAALRAAPPPYWGPSPFFDGGWVWAGHGWAWRPRWGVGLGWRGGWPY